MQAQGENPPPAQHPYMPSADTPFAVVNTVFICVIISPTLFQGDSQVKRIARKVFDDDFMSCMDKTVKELYDYLKSYSTLMAANGQI